ncbi:BamA/TamA family outer membrane protein [Nemorincola caseinilytica]|uniref:BamA/TamA family outer membrane protein n=1 Tax=Nemorincola caseinilytica TaxID=2054315 RepID=A0ABP8N926_9BACT
MTLRTYIWPLLLVLAAMLSACSNTRRLPAGDRLFRGSKVFITDNEASVKERKLLKDDLAELVRPRPNSKTLGMRLKLRAYTMAGDTKKTKGLRAWLRSKVGEPPVLTADVDLPHNTALMQNYLENRGYFHAHASAHFDSLGKKKARALFYITTGPQYTINNVTLRRDTAAEVWSDINSTFDKETLLKKDQPYNLEVIKAERARIDRMLKEEGYYYFKPDYVFIVADSSIGGHKVNMNVRLKHREIPPEAYRRYTINDVFIYANYRLRGRAQDTGKENKVPVDSYYVIDPRKNFKPQVLADAMVFEKGDEYSMDMQNTTLSRLVNMGNFKFVKNRFEQVGDSLLDVYYYLTPHPRKSLRFEAGAHTQNDNRAGTKGSISWRHRNTFKGAEEFMFKINGGFEAQYSGPVRQPTIYNFGSELSLSFPRFVVPFKKIETPSRFIPRTSIKLKYNFESSAKLINISSYNASYGYVWKEGPRKEHQLYPLNFTYVRTDTVGSPQNLGLLYSNLVFNGIILGPTYDFTYNSQVGLQRKHAVFFSGRVDLSGNILGLVKKADFETNPDLLFGSTYAQYVKLQPDLRHYMRLSRTALLASRLLVGLGIPYGNSASLPNIKQFWAGGNSDLRGFPSRLVGPGTFNEYDSAGSRRFIQTLGDMKLEMNVELRQNIYKFLNVGLFAEAGNIWLFRDNPSLPGGKFTSNFYKELAADAGVGLRFDFQILVLRLDMGMPIRKPWLPEGDRWVLDDIRIADPDWKKKNLIFNIGIGYPF